MNARPLTWESHTLARRGFLGAALALAGGGAAGCSGKTNENSDPAQSAGADEAQLVSQMPGAQGAVDLVRWNLPAGEPSTLDPRNAATYSAGQVAANLFDSLLTTNPDYSLHPGLATMDQVSDTRIVFTVRDGVSFWDGSPVTGEDVAFSLTRTKDPAAVVSFYLESVSDIRVTGPMEVTVDFSEPDELFAQAMGNISGAVVSKAFAERVGDAFGTATGGVMGSGPFKLDAWKPGDTITMSRNDGYWNADRRPFAAQVTFSFISDTTALVQALNAGEIDGANQISAAAVTALDSSPLGTLVRGPSMDTISLGVCGPGGALADMGLREAFERMVDRAALARVVYKGAAAPRYSITDPGMFPLGQEQKYAAAYAKFEAARSFDLATAKELVASSTYDGSDIVLGSLAGDAAQSQTAQLVQQQASAAGVAVTLKALQPQEYSSALSEAAAREGLDLLVTTSFNGTHDPLESVSFTYLPGPYNWTGYDDPDVVRLLTQARRTIDADARTELFLQAQEVFEPANCFIPLVSIDSLTFVNEKLTGAVTSFAYWSMPNMAFVGAREA